MRLRSFRVIASPAPAQLLPEPSAATTPHPALNPHPPTPPPIGGNAALERAVREGLVRVDDGLVIVPEGELRCPLCAVVGIAERVYHESRSNGDLMKRLREAGYFKRKLSALTLSVDGVQLVKITKYGQL
ncbi:hypothetical protein V1504DRAFT_430651 [Lipomyces starkeyi]